MKRFGLELLKAVALYVLIVVGGTFVFMSFAPVFGYLPYSDRPGPGWFGSFPAVGWLEFWGGVRFFLSWVLLLLPYTVVIGLLAFALVRVLELIRLPRIFVAIIAAPVAGFLSGYIVLGIGWYIAIAAAPVYLAAILGLCCGAFVLPRSKAARERCA